MFQLLTMMSPTDISVLVFQAGETTSRPTLADAEHADGILHPCPVSIKDAPGGVRGCGWGRKSAATMNSTQTSG